jgi:hypothetical protein
MKLNAENELILVGFTLRECLESFFGGFLRRQASGNLEPVEGGALENFLLAE